MLQKKSELVEHMGTFLIDIGGTKSDMKIISKCIQEFQMISDSGAIVFEYAFLERMRRAHTDEWQNQVQAAFNENPDFFHY